MGLSRILKDKKVVIFISILLLLMSFFYNIKLTFVLVLIYAFLLVNLLLRKQMNREGFSFYKNKRGADYLIVGVDAKIPNLSLENLYALKYTAPNRTLLSSFEIAKRLYSILNEQGTLIIVVNQKQLNDLSFSIFDFAFLHPIQLIKYNVEYLRFQNFFPLIFAPIKILKTYFPSKKLAEEPSHRIFSQNDFCQYISNFWKERNVNFKLLIVK